MKPPNCRCENENDCQSCHARHMGFDFYFDCGMEKSVKCQNRFSFGHSNICTCPKAKQLHQKSKQSGHPEIEGYPAFQDTNNEDAPGIQTVVR